MNKEQKVAWDRVNKKGTTPLVQAIFENKPNLAMLLLKNGFYNEKYKQNGTQMTVLHKCSGIKWLSLLEELIKKFRSQINSQDVRGNTPLHYAAWYRNKGYVELLIKNKSKINSKNFEGNTPLHLAWAANNQAKDHSLKIEQLLLKHKADANITNNNGQIPTMMLFNYERQSNFLEMSDFDKLDNYGRSVLHYICMKGATIPMISLLDKTKHTEK
jgi:ankyrin repeat protein